MLLKRTTTPENFLLSSLHDALDSTPVQIRLSSNNMYKEQVKFDSLQVSMTLNTCQSGHFSSGKRKDKMDKRKDDYSTRYTFTCKLSNAPFP